MALEAQSPQEIDLPETGAPLIIPMVQRRSVRATTSQWIRMLLSEPRAAIGGALLLFIVLMALAGPFIFGGDPAAPDYNAISQPPSAHYWLGTDQQGHNIFLQLVYGGRSPLIVGACVGVMATFIAILIGMSAGYFGGWIDEILSLFTNVVLVIPGLVLVVVLASWMRMSNDLPTILILGLTGWAWGARVLRSQTISLRNRDFIMAATVRGEGGLRIVLVEILPNMVSLIVSNFIGTALYAIGAAAGLVFIGVGNISGTSWFTMLYWAQNDQVLLTGAWWTFVPPGLALALLGASLALINFGIDTISNPRLRADRLKPPKAGTVRTDVRQSQPDSAVAIEPVTQ